MAGAERIVAEVRLQLRASLVARYKALLGKLTARLGSKDLASEALHETWLRLREGSELQPIDDPEAYLYRAALNTASDLKAAGRRLLAMLELEAILDLPNDTPDAERVVIAKNEVARLRKALAELTPRQRDIFLKSFSGESSHQALAERHGVTVRTIQVELRHSVLHCAKRLSRRNLFAPGALRVSRK